jgi:hypothetical protein
MARRDARLIGIDYLGRCTSKYFFRIKGLVQARGSASHVSESIFQKIFVNRVASSRVIRRRCHPKLSGIQA